jgi:hypothetical protein
MEPVGEDIPRENVPTVNLHLRVPPHVKNEIRDYAVWVDCSLNAAMLKIIEEGLATLRVGGRQ